MHHKTRSLRILVSPSVLVLVIVVWVLLVSRVTGVMVMSGHIVGVMHRPIVHIVWVVSVLLRVVDAGDVLGDSPEGSHSLTRSRGSVI